jgi:hypothetical protein
MQIGDPKTNSKTEKRVFVIAIDFAHTLRRLETSIFDG